MESRACLKLDPIHLRIKREPAAGAQGGEADRLTPGRGAEPRLPPGFLSESMAEAETRAQGDLCVSLTLRGRKF